MMFEWTISTGNLITIAAQVGTIIWMFLSMRADISVLRSDIGHIEKRQDSLNDAFKQLGTILTEVAVQDNRLNMVERNIEEFRHGKGFINK